jgi:acetyl esterase/lipase
MVEQLEGRSLLSASPGPGPGPGHLHTDGHRAPAANLSAARVSNIVYEDVAGRRELLDVYLPRGTPPPGGWPVLMAIHGGGWRRYSKDEYGPEIAGMFTPGGVAVVAMNYTLSSRGAASWPANFEDVRNAVRWTRANAGAYGLDPGRIAAIGESAGGHLAALLGTDPNAPLATATAGAGEASSGDAYGAVSAQVRGVVDFYGPTNLAALERTSALARPAVTRFLGGKPRQLPQTYADASPVDHVGPASAPMLILQGTQDNLIPRGQPRALAAALRAAGVPERLITVGGAPHGFEFQPSGRKLLPTILAFLHAVWQG